MRDSIGEHSWPRCARPRPSAEPSLPRTPALAALVPGIPRVSGLPVPVRCVPRDRARASRLPRVEPWSPSSMGAAGAVEAVERGAGREEAASEEGRDPSRGRRVRCPPEHAATAACSHHSVGGVRQETPAGHFRSSSTAIARSRRRCCSGTRPGRSEGGWMISSSGDLRGFPLLGSVALCVLSR